MKITANTVVSIDYTLTDDDGEIIDTSKGQAPLTYLHGHGQIVAGLERHLEGRESGDSLQADIAPADAYGEYDSGKVLRVPRGELPEDLTPEVGMRLLAEGPNGESVPLWVVEVSPSEVTLDGNHPLAGQTLHFAVDVREVRQATEEELEHGHVHGPGGEHE